MDLTFEFENGPDDSYEDFTYEIENGDAEDYILRTHSFDDILSDYIDYIYPNETEETKNTYKDDFGFDGTKECLKDMNEDDKEELAREVVYDLIELDLYNGELRDYFEEEAYEVYKDMKAYNRDPYAYYGLSQSDFL